MKNVTQSVNVGSRQNRTKFLKLVLLVQKFSLSLSAIWNSKLGSTAEPSFATYLFMQCSPFILVEANQLNGTKLVPRSDPLIVVIEQSTGLRSYL